MSASASSHPLPFPRRKVQQTVLNFMDGSRLTSLNNTTNPPHLKPATDIFDLLRRAVRERQRIEVLTRDCRGIYGILTGWLIAFDRHMNLIMSDVDEVFRRLTDGRDYLELGSQRQAVPPAKANTSASKPTDVTNDFQTFRAQLANFLRNKKKQPIVAKPKQSVLIDDDNDEEEEEEPHPCQSHPEELLTMELLSINNVTVQRLSNRSKHSDSCSSKPSTAIISSKRPKVRFFSRHIPKLFVKGNQVCLIRLLSS